MLEHQHCLDDYLKLYVDTYSAMSSIEHFSLNKKLLCPTSALASQIFYSLEGLTPDNRIKNFIKAADKYANAIADMIKRHSEIFKKQIALITETIPPLIKVNTIFKNIYKDQYAKIMQTPVIYFPCAKNLPDNKEGSFQFFIVEKLSLDASEDIEVIRQDLVKYLGCQLGTDKQLEYPDFSPITTPWKKPSSITELGYTVEYVEKGIERLALTGEHVKLNSNLLGFLGNIDTIKNRIVNTAHQLKDMPDDLPAKIGEIENGILSLQTYAVLLGSLITVLQATAYSAYEAAYRIHVAEIDYNKSIAK